MIIDYRIIGYDYRCSELGTVVRFGTECDLINKINRICSFKRDLFVEK